MSVSRSRQIFDLEDKAGMLRQRIAWAEGERKIRLREELADVEAHIRFLKRADEPDPHPEQMRLFEEETFND